jgi:ribonuclease HI
MSKKEKVEKLPDTPLGGIFYSDGGCRGAGFGGWGIHGYIYSDQAPKKGAGQATNLVTNLGYVEKSTVKDKTTVEEVKPLYYINSYGSYGYPITNNIAELEGATNSLEVALKYNLKLATVMTDSEMVVNGANSWLESWKKNNWVKSDGNPVANKQYWQALDNNLQKLKEAGTTVTVKWVKGHSTHLGNQLADKLATVAVMQAKESIAKTQIDTVPADGYWSTVVERNPFLSQRRAYFTTRVGSCVPGEYFLGDHGKDDDLIGKRSADGCFSYVKLKEPDLAIEMLRNRQTYLAKGLDIIVMARLDKLFEPSTYKDVFTYGESCFYCPSTKKLDMHYLDKDPITKELRPPRQAIRAVEALNVMKGLLLSWQSGLDKKIKQTDITSLIYDLDKDSNCKLKPEFIAGFTTLEVQAHYGTETIEKVEKLNLCMGVDLPERNTLKKLEKHNPKVILITWMESSNMFRHATIIKTQYDIGIWSGMCSNQKFVS